MRCWWFAVVGLFPPKARPGRCFQRARTEQSNRTPELRHAAGTPAGNGGCLLLGGLPLARTAGGCGPALRDHS
eukprot:10837242-Alexandrium_andersonii.AAC.1